MSEYETIIQQLAKGLSYRESVEEYQRADNGELVLIKKRETTRHAIPDFQALKFLLEREEKEFADFSHWTIEELKAEKIRLLKELAAAEIATESGV